MLANSVIAWRGFGVKFGICYTLFIMKIIFLNTWNGRVQPALTKFLEEQAKDTDIFCFEEAYDEMKQLARETFPGYAEFEKYKYVTDDDNFPQATYIRKEILLLSSGAVLEYEENVGLGLYVEIPFKNKTLCICNFHGMSRPVDKLDDRDRIRQSERLIDFFRHKKGPKIIGGDFNLFPDTKSIRMFQENGYRDLIKEYGITNTRNRFAWELYPDNKQYYSDYVFVSPDVAVKNLSVPDIEISDHLPLILEIA